MRETASTPLEPHALLAGGGTGGHVFPALAVAEELVRRRWKVSFTGSAQGLEERLVRARGLPFSALPARPLLGRDPLSQLRALWTVARSTLAARRMIRRSAVDVVIGTGGYVSAPAVLGARLARRPSLLVEPNAGAGLANRWLSRWASGAAVAYAQTLDQMRCPAWVTGVPVREEFFRVRPLTVSEARTAAEPRMLLVLGGSQGARQLNLSLPAALEEVEERLPTLRVVHQAGARHVEETLAAYEEVSLSRIEVEVVPFLEDIAAAMERADLLVSRAGALTTAEIAAAGRPALLVPLAIAAGHQLDNARVLADAGAARILESEDLTPPTLAAVLLDLLSDGRRLEAMGRAARSLAREAAAAQIADRVEELAGTRAASGRASGQEVRE